MHLTPGACSCQWLPRDSLDLIFPVRTVALEVAEAFALEALLNGFVAVAEVESEAVHARAGHLEVD